jgi:hypothetical protein
MSMNEPFYLFKNGQKTMLVLLQHVNVQSSAEVSVTLLRLVSAWKVSEGTKMSSMPDDVQEKILKSKSIETQSMIGIRHFFKEHNVDSIVFSGQDESGTFYGVAFKADSLQTITEAIDALKATAAERLQHPIPEDSLEERIGEVKEGFFNVVVGKLTEEQIEEIGEAFPDLSDDEKEVPLTETNDEEEAPVTETNDEKETSATEINKKPLKKSKVEHE